MSDQLVLGVVTAVTSLLGTIAAGIIALYMAKVSKKADTAATKVEEVKTTLENTTDAAAKVAGDLDRKLDGVKKTGEAVHVLVNSAMSAQLKIAAIALRRIADLTKHPDDISAAVIAERGYDEHAKKQTAVDHMTGIPNPEIARGEAT